MHLHDDALVLLALSEEPTTEEASHLESCARCQAEVGSYARVVRAARNTDTLDRSAPPPEVWEHIHDTLGLGPEVRRDPLADAPSGANGARGAGGHAGTPEQGAQGGARDARKTTGNQSRQLASASPQPKTVSLDERRGRRSTRWLAAAAAAALVAGAATWGIARSLAPQPEVLASIALAPLPSYSDEGTATVDQLPDGERELIVTASSSYAEGYREVWLISPDITSMVSLGTMEGREARFRIPDGLDLSAYPIVDISDEPLDGNPEHSGNSILRGQLEL